MKMPADNVGASVGSI